MMKKVLRETQTLFAVCSKAEPRNFAPQHTPDYYGTLTVSHRRLIEMCRSYDLE